MSAGGHRGGGGIHATRIISASHASNHLMSPPASSGFDAATSHDSVVSHQPQSGSSSRPPRDYNASFPGYNTTVTPQRVMILIFVRNDY